MILLLNYALLSLWLLFIVLPNCGGKKKDDDDEDDEDMSSKNSKKSKQSKREKKKPSKPKEHKMAETNNPNYQTLAGLVNDDIFKNKGGSPGGAPAPAAPMPPAQHKFVGTHDPNYMTLAGLANEDVFKAKPAAGAGGNFGSGGGFDGGAAPRAPAYSPGQKKMVGTHDPNYQTLAGLVNDDVFKPKAPQGGGMGAQKPNDHKVVATNDPNYQTLAAINADCFGADKKKATPADPNRFLTY